MTHLLWSLFIIIFRILWEKLVMWIVTFLKLTWSTDSGTRKCFWLHANIRCSWALQLLEIGTLLCPREERVSHQPSRCLQTIWKGFSCYPSQQPVMGRHQLRFRDRNDIDEVIEDYERDDIWKWNDRQSEIPLDNVKRHNIRVQHRNAGVHKPDIHNIRFNRRRIQQRQGWKGMLLTWRRSLQNLLYVHLSLQTLL